MRWVSSPCHREEYRNIECLSNLPKVVQVISRRVGVHNQAIDSKGHDCTISHDTTTGCIPSYFTQIVRPSHIVLDTKSSLAGNTGHDLLF